MSGMKVCSIGRGCATLALLVLLSGCQTVDVVTGKDRVQRELERTRADSTEKIEELEERNGALDQENRDLQTKLAALEAQHSDAMKELETLRRERSSAAGRINVLLFRGDIIYSIAPEAFGDYRAGLRLHALNDSQFGESLKQFEDSRGGDAALLRLLRSIDADDDRLIRLEEANAFREQQEGSLNPEGK